MSAIYNFCAGPAMLPQAVMQKAQQELVDWNGPRRLRDGNQSSQ